MTDHQIALVSGANKGIGKALVRQLLERGHTVYLGSRDRERGEAALRELSGTAGEARLLWLDLADASSIEAAASQVAAQAGQLDILVNNAGVVSGREPPSRSGIAELRAAYETNFFGPFQLTQALLPCLLRSRRPTVVNVSSGLSSLTLGSYPMDGPAALQRFPYQSSKAALNSLTVFLARELRAQGVRVNSFSPGFTATDMNGHQGTDSVEKAARDLLRYALMDDDGPTGGFFMADGTVPW